MCIPIEHDFAAPPINFRSIPLLYLAKDRINCDRHSICASVSAFTNLSLPDRSNVLGDVGLFWNMLFLYLLHISSYNSMFFSREMPSCFSDRQIEGCFFCLFRKDSIFLTDDELYSALCSYISKEYSIKTPLELSAQQKIDTARHLHFNFNATNQQLRRMLRMDIAILEEIFPL